ncbi:ras-related protein Rab-40B isoform X2 [Mustela nigripes]|nr:ras-related protein Rab-40B isoform X2 [Mustela nigripes]
MGAGVGGGTMSTLGSPVRAYDFLLKFLLVGDSDVGKGEILASLQDGAAESPYGHPAAFSRICMSDILHSRYSVGFCHTGRLWCKQKSQLQTAAWYRPGSGHTDPVNGTEPGPGPAALPPAHLRHSREQRPMETSQSLQQMVPGTQDSHVRKSKTRPFPYTTHKNRLQVDERPQCDTGSRPDPRGHRQRPLRPQPQPLLPRNVAKGKGSKGENELLGLPQDQSFCAAKETVIKTKRQTTGWKKVFANDNADRGLAFSL